MMKMKPQKKKKSKKLRVVEVDPNSIAYNGPTRFPAPLGVSIDDAIVVPLCYTSTISTGAGGAVQTVLDSQAQMVASSDWTTYSGLYSEFRLLSMDVTFIPTHYVNTTGGIVRKAVFSVEDRQNTSALGSDADALSYSTSVVAHPPATTFRKVMKMSGPGESSWISTASSPATTDRLYIKLWSNAGTASLLIYDYFTVMMVQFRNRK